MDYLALKAEIGLSAYEGMTNDQIVAALNASTIPTAVDIQISALEGFLLLQGLIPVLETYIDAGTDAGALASAKTLARLVSSARLDIIQTAVAAVMSVFASLVAALANAEPPVISQAQHDEVLSLAAGTISRAQQLIGMTVNVGHIQTARAQ